MPRRRLDAWKEIAQYLGRDVTTVRRWEKREGLPVHRHLHDKLGSVYAYTDEVDAWTAGRSTKEVPRVEMAEAPPIEPAPPNESLPAAAGPIVSRARPWSFGLGVVATVAVIAAATSSPWSPRARAGADPLVRLALTPPAGSVVNTLALSPDGNQVLFCAADSKGTRIWIRRVDSTVAEPLAGTEGAAFPFWSADGQHFGFFANERLKVFATATREVRDLAAARDGRGGTWNERGDIVFAPDRESALWHVPASGGEARAITTLAADYVQGHGWPEFLPDGQRFLYTDYSSDPNRYGIHVGNLLTGATKRILPVYSSASYSPEGFLLFVKDSLMAQRFDLSRLELSGEPRTLAPRVLQRYDLGHQADFSLSRSGLIAVRSADRELHQLRWIDRTGRELRTMGRPAWYSNPTLSPDGRSLIATIDEDSDANLWTFDIDGGAGTRISFGSPVDFAPVWSPRGKEILFATPRGVFQQAVAGGGSPEPVLRSRLWQTPESWSADGRYLTVQTLSQTTKSDVWRWQLADHRNAFPVLNTPANEGQSQISPDGRYLAYASDESGRFEVYVQTFPKVTGRWQVSTGGGADPKWRRDGGELYYIAANRRMMAVSVGLRPTFRRGAATPLFQTQFDSLWMDTRNHYDVTADGRRFVVIAPITDRRLAPFTLLVNWQKASGN